MPVHIRSPHGDLRLTLSNGDDVLDVQVAATPSMTTVTIVLAALSLGAAFGFCWREIAAIIGEAS